MDRSAPDATGRQVPPLTNPLNQGQVSSLTASFLVEPLQGWHLPLLDDPAFVSLQPLLQRALLLAMPERLIHAFRPRQPLASRVWVALSRNRPGRPLPLGLIVTQRHNRSGSCWQVEHLRLATAVTNQPGTPGHPSIHAGLLREAIHQARGAASWIATASSLDGDRLAALREQGFQPQRTDHLWRWQGPPGATCLQAPLPPDLQLRPLNRRNACLLWHLEQAACPAQLRQLLDRRVEDLLDHCQGQAWILINSSRNEAVAAVRPYANHPGGGLQVEFSVHPGWAHLLGPATEALLGRVVARAGTIWLRSEVGDEARQAWLEQLGAEALGEEILMARSVWRRQEGQPAHRAVRRLEAVLEQFQPRRRPMPTPLGPVPPPMGCNRA